MLVFKVDGVETHRTTTDVPDSPMFLIRRLGAVRRLDGGAIEAATRFRLADRPKDFELLHDANTIYFRRGFYFRHRLARRPDRARMRRSALGIFRVGEDGRLYLISKSEHYHTPLGHGFPGYTLLDCARQLGIPNATHNNTRGQITRLLEEELVAAVNGHVASRLIYLPRVGLDALGGGGRQRFSRRRISRVAPHLQRGAGLHAAIRRARHQRPGRTCVARLPHHDALGQGQRPSYTRRGRLPGGGRRGHCPLQSPRCSRLTEA